MDVEDDGEAEEEDAEEHSHAQDITEEEGELNHSIYDMKDASPQAPDVTEESFES